MRPFGNNSIKSMLSCIREKERIETKRNHFNLLRDALNIFFEKYSILFKKHPICFGIEKGTVHFDKIHSHHEIPAHDIKEILSQLCPWRKGPFSILGTFIDAEWRSDKKWDRLNLLYDNYKLCFGKKILDVGCNNCYYSFRMLAEGATMVLGIDPIPKYSFYNYLYSIIVPQLPLFFEMCGVENVAWFRNYFDVVFCMGILYHQRNPLYALEMVKQSLCKGGMVVIETLCIDSVEDICLFPKKEYQKSRGYWFIPSPSVLYSWLRRSGFDIVAHDTPVETNISEQRKTEWIDSQSLESFIITKKHGREYIQKTIEGYPPPYRTIVLAKKK